MGAGAADATGQEKTGDHGEDIQAHDAMVQDGCNSGDVGEGQLGLQRAEPTKITQREAIIMEGTRAP